MKVICMISLLFLAPAVFAAESVNLQWSICDSSPESVLSKLGVNQTDPDKIAQITYYDTNPPTAIQQGIALRTKDKKHGTESLVKVRFPQVQEGVPSSADCAWERYGSQENYSCEMSGSSTDDSSLWSDDQTSFVHLFGSVNWPSLVGFGSYENPKWEVDVAGHEGAFDTVNADSGPLMELEIDGVDKSEDDSVYRSVTQALTRAGVNLCVVQEGKTFRLFRAMGLLSR